MMLRGRQMAWLAIAELSKLHAPCRHGVWSDRVFCDVHDRLWLRRHGGATAVRGCRRRGAVKMTTMKARIIGLAGTPSDDNEGLAPFMFFTSNVIVMPGLAACGGNDVRPAVPSGSRERMAQGPLPIAAANAVLCAH